MKRLFTAPFFAECFGLDAGGGDYPPVFFDGGDFYVVIDALGCSLVFKPDGREPCAMYEITPEFETFNDAVDFMIEIAASTPDEVLLRAKNACPDPSIVEPDMFDFRG